MSLLELIGLIASVIAIVEFIFKAPALIKKIYDVTLCRFLNRFFSEKPAYSDEQPFLQGSYRKGTRIVIPDDFEFNITPVFEK